MQKLLVKTVADRSFQIRPRQTCRFSVVLFYAHSFITNAENLFYSVITNSNPRTSVFSVMSYRNLKLLFDLYHLICFKYVVFLDIVKFIKSYTAFIPGSYLSYIILEAAE